MKMVESIVIRGEWNSVIYEMKISATNFSLDNLLMFWLDTLAVLNLMSVCSNVGHLEQQYRVWYE